MNNVIGHFKTVCNHKKYVYEACKSAGIPIQGFFHDFSKFHPIEFLESVKYYSGDRSPIDNCKDINGYSLAWFHHRGRNKHHWEYWVDNFEKGMTPTLMPFKYSLEMLCDFIGAGKAYKKENFSYENEWEWWLWKRERVIMHPIVWHFINTILEELKIHPEMEDIIINYEYCKTIYNNLLNSFNNNHLKGEFKSIL